MMMMSREKVTFTKRDINISSKKRFNMAKRSENVDAFDVKNIY